MAEFLTHSTRLLHVFCFRGMAGGLLKIRFRKRRFSRKTLHPSLLKIKQARIEISNIYVAKITILVDGGRNSLPWKFF